LKISIPKSPHVRKSGIRNPTFFSLWNPESWALESGIQSLESGIQPVDPTRGSTSSIIMASWSGMYYTVSSNYVPAPPPGVPYHHRHQKVFARLTPTFSMSLLRLGGFLFLTGHKFKLIFCHVVFLNFSDLDPHCLLNDQRRLQLFPFMRVSHRATYRGIRRLPFYSAVLMIC